MLRSRRKRQFRNIGLLILRIGLGISFMIHGYPKIFGGPEMWAEVGTATQYLGIDFAPMFFGFIAGATEFFGGIFLILGLFFTPSLVLLIIVMIVATISRISLGDPYAIYSHSIEVGIVLISLLFIGPGQYNLDNKLHKSRRRY